MVGCFTMGMKNGVNLFEFIETTMVASISFILVYLSFVLPISFWLAYKNYFYCDFYTNSTYGRFFYFLWNQPRTNSTI